MNIIQRYKEASRVEGSEHGQGLIRVVIVALLAMYAGHLLTNGLKAPWLVTFFLTANLNALCLFLHILSRPSPNPVRRCIGIVNDQLLIALLMRQTGMAGSVYFFVFTFVTVGNGFRYGNRYLALSGVLATIGIWSLICFSPLWQDYSRIGYGLLITHVLLTGYTGALLSKLRKAKTQLEFLAMRDALTGLPNRHSFLEKLEEGLVKSMTGQSDLACIYFDLDGFKKVNDSFGHHAGDSLLKLIAEKVSRALRPTDFLARLGGDEFTIILDEMQDPADAGLTASRMIQLIEDIKEIEGNAISVSASFGIAYTSALPHLECDTMLKAADEAMHRAKKKGKGRFEIAHFKMHVPTIAA